MRDDCLDLRRQREFIVITSGCGKEKTREGVTEREARGSQRDAERKLFEKCVFLAHSGIAVLCSREITEREWRWERGGEAEQVDKSQHVAWGKNCGSGEEK